MVAAQHELLLNGLGVNHLRLLLGTSMGCMHGWVWGERYPTFVDGLVNLACAPTQIAGRNRWTRKMMIEFIRNDPSYAGGDYTSPPLAGLRAADLEKISSYVLAINSADDFINPPELGVMEKLIPRVKHARYVLLPATDQTRGHGTHSLPAVWKSYLADFLKLIEGR